MVYTDDLKRYVLNDKIEASVDNRFDDDDDDDDDDKWKKQFTKYM